MATLAYKEIAFGTLTMGATPTYAGFNGAAALDSAAVGGDQFINDGRVFLRVKNGSGSPITVTVAAQKKASNGTQINCVFSVPATTGDVMIGPFTDDFSDANGYCQVTYSGVTTLTVGAMHLSQTGR